MSKKVIITIQVIQNENFPQTTATLEKEGKLIFIKYDVDRK